MEAAFYNDTNLQVSATDVPDLTGVTSLKQMFDNCTSLNGPSNIDSWNVSNINDFTFMFSDASNFNQPLNNWNTANAKYMVDMFAGASAFNQPLNNWNTGNVTSMYGMFSFAINFNQPLNSWNTNKVTDISFMFANASVFNQPLNNWNTSNVTNMDGMFKQATNFNQPLYNWNTTNVTGMQNMFYNAKAFNQDIGDWQLATFSHYMLDSSGMDCINYSLSLNGWANNPNNTNVVLGVANLKYGTTAQNNRNTLINNGWLIYGDTASGTSCYSLPKRCFVTKWHFPTSATSINFNRQIWGSNTNYAWTASPSGNTGSGTIPWDSVKVIIPINIANGDTVTLGIEPNFKNFRINNNSNIIDVAQWGNANWTSMKGAFYNDSNLQVSATDVPNLAGATSLEGMFRNCTALNGPSNINSWDISNITNTADMFNGATNFNQPLNNWNTSKIIDATEMFRGATNFDQPLNNWNTSNVKFMWGMFDGATNFNQPLNNWNTSNATFMAYMFNGATNFNQPLNNWNTNKVVNMSVMFCRAANFNQPLNNWNTSNLVDMHYMFLRAYKFNQPINNWNVSKVTDMTYMFYNARAFNQRLDSLVFAKNANAKHMLDSCNMDCSNYSLTLNGWANNPLNSDSINLGAANLKFGTNAQNTHTALTNTKHWTIVGDTTSGALCNPILPSCNTMFTITKDTIAANTWNMYIQNTTPNMQLQLSYGDSTTTALLPVDSLNNTTHTYADSGMYSVCLTAIDSVANCTNSYCDSLAAYRLNGVMKYLKISTKLNANSIITKLTTNTIKLYPNPTTNTLTLSAAQALGTIALHNTLGQVVYTIHSTNATHTINTSSLSSGMYYVTVGNTTHKVIKE